VGNRDRGHPRRSLLGGAAGVAGTAALGGCGIFDRNDDEPEKAADPLQPLLTETLTLAVAYDRAALAQPALAARLTPLGADHKAHATALAQLIGADEPSTAPSASAAGSPSTLADLRKAEQTAQKNAAAACRTAPAARAALLGSITASRAAHAEALK
jgi:hypothetical protein